jgi:hypothetical protein
MLAAFRKLRVAFLEWKTCRAFLRKKTNAQLQELLAVAFSNQHPLKLKQIELRDSLIACSPSIPDEHLADFFFHEVERFLLSAGNEARPEDWVCWVAARRRGKRELDVRDPAVSHALAEAYRTRKLARLSTTEQIFILDAYRKAYGEVLAAAGKNLDADLLPLFMEFAAIAQVLPGNDAAGVLRHWTSLFGRQPRSLFRLTNEEADSAPIRGIGSPNGASITMYYSAGDQYPTRICAAGTTPDPTLNSHLFSSLFATALACDTEPTLITTVGAVLSLKASNVHYGGIAAPLLAAALGPGGPIEPGKDTPFLGMSASESVLLVSDVFERFQNITGLIKVMTWDFADPAEIDEWAVHAIENGEPDGQQIHSDPSLSEGSTVIHFMPLLHRGPNGRAIPAEVRIPYRVLGGHQIFELLLAARSIYMKRLIEDGRRREAMAWQTHKEHQQASTRWLELSDAERAAECQRWPTITITGQYDFRLGLVVPLRESRQVSRREYEEEIRPAIIRDAKEFAMQFSELCKKLEAMNAEGGRAEILTFKLLVDSVIRSAPLPIPSEEISTLYNSWGERCRPAIWAAVEAFARSLGYPPELLAADNVVFNARLESSSQEVVIQPWLVVDLHDFILHVEAMSGTLRVFPAGKTPGLRDFIIDDEERGVANPRALHACFEEWVKQTSGVEQMRAQSNTNHAKGVASSRIRDIVEFNRGRRLLFDGHIDEALSCFEGVRGSDLAPVYFWGAVAHQYRFLKSAPVAPRRSTLLDRFWVAQDFMTGNIPVRLTGHDNLLIGAIDMVKNALRNPDQDRARIVPQGMAYLEQLRGRDAQFVSELLTKGANIPQIEANSLKLSHDEERELHAVSAAINAIELLDFAEQLKQVARALPFQGGISEAIKKSTHKVLGRADRVGMNDMPEAAQLNEIRKLI